MCYGQLDKSGRCEVCGDVQYMRFTDMRILQLACRAQGFTVSWNRRDADIRNQCSGLMRNGWLTRERSTFKITPAGIDAVKEMQKKDRSKWPTLKFEWME